MTDPQTTIPEPTDGRRVVVDNGPTSSTPLRLFWRDDTEAKRWGGQPGEHWFDDNNTDPLCWREVLRYAKAVYLAPEQPMGGTNASESVLEITAAAIRVADASIEGDTRALAEAITAAVGGMGVRWQPATVSEVIGKVDGWDEIGDRELAHHIVAGMHERERSATV